MSASRNPMQPANGRGAVAPRSPNAPYEDAYTKIQDRFDFDFNEIYRRAEELEIAWVTIATQLIGNVKKEDFAIIWRERFRREVDKTKHLETTAYDVENTEIIEAMRRVSTNLSYVIDVLERINKSVKETKMPIGSVNVPYYGTPVGGQLGIGKPGITERIMSFFSGHEDTERMESLERLELFSATIKMAYICLERWDAYVMQFNEHRYIRATWGVDVMTGYLKTDIRNLAKVKNLISPYADYGLRYNISQMQEIFSTMAADITRMQAAKAEASAMYQDMGKGIGQSIGYGAIKGAAGQALPGNP